MNPNLQMQVLSNDISPLAMMGARPIISQDRRQDRPYIQSANGLRVHSMLRRDEWVEFDRAVVAAALPPLRITSMLERAGLVSPLGSLNTMVSQYYAPGEMTPANVSLRGHSIGDKDLVDIGVRGVPIPIIFKEFELDARIVGNNRALGEPIETINAAAAARVVAEKFEDIVILGDTSINLNGNILYGITTHPDILTDTATNVGGGDWGTATNITGTVAGMINALQANHYYGPYALLAATQQYNEASLVYYADASGDTPRDRILRMPGITAFEQIPQLTAGTLVLLQLTADVIDLKRLESYWPVTNLEWTSGDGMQYMFKALTVGAPRVKVPSGGKAGIIKVTGA